MASQPVPTLVSSSVNNNSDDNISNALIDVWAERNICNYLDNISDATVTLICGVDLYLPPFLFIAGLFSNSLVVLIMRGRSFRSLSTSLYMSVNAVIDLACILIALPAHYIFVNAPQVFESARNAHAMCSFFNVIGWGTSDLGILITVAMTTERAIAIKYPLRAHKLCTAGKAKVVIAGLTGFELIKVSHFVFKSRVVSDTRSRLCDVDRNDGAYAAFILNVWPWLHFSILFVSYLIVMVANSVLYINIRRSFQDDLIDCVGRTSNGGTPSLSFKNRQVSLMLLIDSVSLIVCTLPYSIVCILMTYTQLRLDTQGGKNLIFTITFYLLYLNRCLNFFLYCISGSRFRSALKSLFTPSPCSSVLNLLITRRAQTVSVLRKSKDQHVSVLDKCACDVTPEVLATHRKASFTVSGALIPLSIFLTSSSAEFKINPVRKKEAPSDVTHL